MGPFKRFCLFVYVLASVTAFGMLVLPWRGPWTSYFNPLFANSVIYAYVLFACLGISALGLLHFLGRVLFSPRPRKTICVESVEGGSITIGVDAISEQVKYIINSHSEFEAAKVMVTNKGKSLVDIFASVRPTHATELAKIGQDLQNEITERVDAFAGGAVNSVSLEFLSAIEQDFREPIAVEAITEPVYDSVAPSTAISSDVSAASDATGALETAEEAQARTEEELEGVLPDVSSAE